MFQQLLHPFNRLTRSTTHAPAGAAEIRARVHRHESHQYDGIHLR